MEKLTKLTPEQEAHIPVLRKKWEDVFYQNQNLDLNEAKKYITWIYKNYLKKEAPVVMVMKSPLGCQVLISLLRELKINKTNLRDNIWANLGDNIWANLGDNLRVNLWANLEANLGDNLRANLRANIWDNIWANLGDNLRANLRANLMANLRANLGANLEANLMANLMANLGDNLDANLIANLRDNLRGNYQYSSNWINIGDYGWVAFYDFIQKTGHFKTYNFNDFDNYKKLLETGIYELYVFDGICIICEMPKVKQNANNQLHNVLGSAVEWRDGWSQYFVNGRAIEKELIEEGFTKNDLIKEENEDKKAAMITIVKERDGDKGLLNFLGAVVVDEKKILHFEGYEETVRLYKTKESYDILQDRHGNMGQPYCWSEIVCPSTKSTYIIENSADFTDAEEALKFLRPSFIPEELLYRWEAFAN